MDGYLRGLHTRLHVFVDDLDDGSLLAISDNIVSDKSKTLYLHPPRHRSRPALRRLERGTCLARLGCAQDRLPPTLLGAIYQCQQCES